MKGKSGTVYGWCSYTYDEDGKVVSRHVVMNEKVLNANTGVHEMGHLWLRWKNKKALGQCLKAFCEPPGDRTLDPQIKSLLLYQLS